VSDPPKKKKVPNAQPKRIEYPIFDGQPKPTVFKGGIKRMMQIWNDLRDMNTGAYGSGRLIAKISTWPGTGTGLDKLPVTSCSPFTSTVIGILFDPDGTAKGTSHPKYDGDPTTHLGTKDIENTFVQMHNGNYKTGPVPKGVARDDINHSGESCLFFNLGYEVQPKDLRRGDMVGIDWGTGGGHAVFVWDVHLAKPDPDSPDHYQPVDAFCYLSANGSINTDWLEEGDPKDPTKSKADPTKPRKQAKDNFYTGPGITIGGCDGKAYINHFWKAWNERASDQRGEIKAVQTLFQDRKEHITDAGWLCIPGVSTGDVDPETWAGVDKKHAPRPADYTNAWKHYARSLRCVRFWGIAPPERHGETPYEQTQFDLAKMLKYEDPPKSYATGEPTVAPPTFENVQPSTGKGDAEKIKNTDAKKTEQPKKEEKITPQQKWVEDAIGELFGAGWLKQDPGDPTNPNDAETKAAIKEFQEKFKCPPVDGQFRQNVWDGLHKALEDLHAGKDNPTVPKKYSPPPSKLDRVVWLANRARPGDPMYFGIHGNVHDIDHLDIVFTCRKTKKTAKISAEVILDTHGVISRPVGVPKVFEDGAELLTSFSGKGKDGVAVKFDSKTPIYIGPPLVAFALE